MNFRTPRETYWIKVDGEITVGTLTNNMANVPEDKRPSPTANAPQIRGYKRLFCIERGYWVSLYSANILKV